MVLGHAFQIQLESISIDSNIYSLSASFLLDYRIEILPVRADQDRKDSPEQLLAELSSLYERLPLPIPFMLMDMLDLPPLCVCSRSKKEKVGVRNLCLDES
jgi:hypothetical protein